MISVWRLIESEHAETAFSGEGARRFGGRWNELGLSMVYTSGSLSLATLEFFVNLDASPPQEMHLTSIEAQIPMNLIETAKNLPDAWNTLPAPLETQIYGSQWMNNKTAVALKVPSSVIMNEYNYLINPNHPDFKKLKINPPIPFSLDTRMLKAK